MRRQPQVIVRRQIDHLLAIKRALGRLFVLKHAQTEVRAFGLQVFQLVVEIRKRVGASSGCHQNLRRRFTRMNTDEILKHAQAGGFPAY